MRLIAYQAELLTYLEANVDSVVNDILTTPFLNRFSDLSAIEAILKGHSSKPTAATAMELINVLGRYDDGFELLLYSLVHCRKEEKLADYLCRSSMAGETAQSVLQRWTASPQNSGPVSPTQGGAAAFSEIADDDDGFYEEIPSPGIQNAYYVSLSGDHFEFTTAHPRPPTGRALPERPESRIEKEAREIRRKRQSRLLRQAVFVLADVQVCIGVVSLLLGILSAIQLEPQLLKEPPVPRGINVTLPQLSPSVFTYGGVWGGVYMECSGVIGIVAAHSHRRAWMFTFAASSIVFVVAFVPVFTYFQVTEWFKIMFSRCSDMSHFPACGSEFTGLFVVPPVFTAVVFLVCLLSATFACCAVASRHRCAEGDRSEKC